ncbi:MAG: hypothetical protein IJT98_10230, partial [Prevotella sp.]|nr:hypothetical protein [Prevotella sp.]
MIEFRQIPAGWAVCGNESCMQAAKCLRQQAYQAAMESTDWTCCLLPRAWAEKPCRYFAAAEKVLMAAGFEQAFARLRSRDARMGVRLQLTALLGSKGSYYRYKH